MQEFKGELAFKNFVNHRYLCSLLEEIIEVMAVCEKKGLLKFKIKGDIELKNVNDKTVEKELKQGIDKAIKLFWSAAVVSAAVECIEYTEANSLKAVFTFLQAAAVNPKYTNKAKEMLSKLSTTNTDIEAVKELAHVLSTCASSTVKDEILNQLKSVSRSFNLHRPAQSYTHNSRL
eukprot:TRINITY_DN647_c1_g1_i1.p1 TRINITY_DN647_c1_g1~~TRINITY_DN647_c1_g1_i1.p1  ORF type:complete len:201 (+),score=20.28 TRINITY_DN647_c1_g1_i1:78-605(+)